MRINCHFKLVAVIVLLLIGVGSAVGDISKVEREALIALYKSTNGDNWTHKDNWLGPTGTERTWYGVTSDQFGTPMLQLRNNNLVGRIPSELGKFEKLLSLELQNNKLSGPIPPELGNLRQCLFIELDGNQLSGPIPPELANLKNLAKENSDFRYNALYTNDTSLRDFLNSKQVGGDWEGTQTVAPTNVTADALTGDSIKVSWTPIRFKKFSGGYRVFYSTSSGGPYTLFGTTDDKNASFLTVTGLNPGTTYYFVVQTVTNPHDLQKNTVMSENSEEVSGSTKRP